MWKWGHMAEVVLGILTTVFIAVGLNQREENPKLGWFFIVLGCVTFVILAVLLVKGRKVYGVAKLASDMETMSATLADFAGERERSEPANRVRMPKANWDDERKREEWEEQTRELIEYGRATMDIYRRRFGSKVSYLVKEARRLGYEDRELDSLCEHSANRLAIQMLSDKMGALSLRMKREIK